MQNASVSTLILGGLALVLIVLAVALIALVVQGQRRQRQEFRRFQDQLWKGLEGMEDDLLEQSAAQRRELSETMQRTSDGQISLLSNVLKMQGDQLNSLLERNDARMESLRRTLDEGVQRLANENRRQLEEMRQTVDEKLHSTLEKRLNDSFAQVSQRLEQVYKSLGEMHTLASGVGDLKRMLGNVKTRGVWGEMQLGALLEQALTSSQYARNVAVVPGSQERVEFAVILPGKEDRPVYLPIDSKFPQEDYLRLIEASESDDSERAERCALTLERALTEQAKLISDKYIRPPETVDYAIMFLPVESLYAEAARRRGLCERLQGKYRVLVAGPNTLAALLTSLRLGFRSVALEKKSADVLRLLSEVRSEFDQYETSVETVRRRLEQTRESLDQMDVRTRKLQKALRNLDQQ